MFLFLIEILKLFPFQAFLFILCSSLKRFLIVRIGHKLSEILKIMNIFNGTNAANAFFETTAEYGHIVIQCIMNGNHFDSVSIFNVAGIAF